MLTPFGTAVEDPLALEAEGSAFILDAELNRNEEGPLLEYLQLKYGTDSLMKFDLGYLSASILVPKDEA